MPGSPEIIGSGTTPVRSDTLRLLLVKDVNAAIGGGSGSVLSGAGLPTATFPAGPGAGILNAIYTDQNTNNTYSWFLGAWHG